MHSGFTNTSLVSSGAKTRHGQLAFRQLGICACIPGSSVSSSLPLVTHKKNAASCTVSVSAASIQFGMQCRLMFEKTAVDIFSPAHCGVVSATQRRRSTNAQTERLPKVRQIHRDAARQKPVGVLVLAAVGLVDFARDVEENDARHEAESHDQNRLGSDLKAWSIVSVEPENPLGGGRHAPGALSSGVRGAAATGDSTARHRGASTANVLHTGGLSRGSVRTHHLGYFFVCKSFARREKVKGTKNRGSAFWMGRTARRTSRGGTLEKSTTRRKDVIVREQKGGYTENSERKKTRKRRKIARNPA